MYISYVENPVSIPPLHIIDRRTNEWLGKSPSEISDQ